MIRWSGICLASDVVSTCRCVRTGGWENRGPYTGDDGAHFEFGLRIRIGLEVLLIGEYMWEVFVYLESY